MLLTWLS